MAYRRGGYGVFWMEAEADGVSSLLRRHRRHIDTDQCIGDVIGAFEATVAALGRPPWLRAFKSSFVAGVQCAVTGR